MIKSFAIFICMHQIIVGKAVEKVKEKRLRLYLWENPIYNENREIRKRVDL